MFFFSQEKIMGNTHTHLILKKVFFFPVVEKKNTEAENFLREYWLIKNFGGRVQVNWEILYTFRYLFTLNEILTRTSGFQRPLQFSPLRMQFPACFFFQTVFFSVFFFLAKFTWTHTLVWKVCFFFPDSEKKTAFIHKHSFYTQKIKKINFSRAIKIKHHLWLYK